jgi:hypothetical protein
VIVSLLWIARQAKKAAIISAPAGGRNERESVAN